MSEERMDRVLDTLRELYNPPGEAPREAMWNAIAADLAAPEVLDLTAERRRRDLSTSRSFGWAVAAAALLVIGIGIGRMTAPGADVTPMAIDAVAAQRTLSFAAAEHFGRTEALLTMVRADARGGRLDPDVSEWANGLLSETRLLIDAESGDPAVAGLLEDLELVLAQIVGVVKGGTMDESRARTELQLALRGLEDRELLSRLQAAAPRLGLAGTQ